MREATGRLPRRLREIVLNNRANSVATSHRILSTFCAAWNNPVSPRARAPREPASEARSRAGGERTTRSERPGFGTTRSVFSNPPDREAGFTAQRTPRAKGGRSPTPGAWRAGALEVVHQVDAGASVLARLVLALVHLVLAVDALVARDTLPGASERAQDTSAWGWRRGAQGRLLPPRPAAVLGPAAGGRPALTPSSHRSHF